MKDKGLYLVCNKRVYEVADPMTIHPKVESWAMRSPPSACIIFAFMRAGNKSAPISTSTGLLDTNLGSASSMRGNRSRSVAERGSEYGFRGSFFVTIALTRNFGYCGTVASKHNLVYNTESTVKVTSLNSSTNALEIFVETALELSKALANFEVSLVCTFTRAVGITVRRTLQDTAVGGFEEDDDEECDDVDGVGWSGWGEEEFHKRLCPCKLV